jgi:hypothetical protein
MASSLPAIVLYAGGAATYVCEEGDVQPTYPYVQPITEELLRSLEVSPSATASCNTGGDRLAPSVKQSTTLIRHYLFPLLHERTVFVVLPLGSSASYREGWVRLCFGAEVRVRRLVVLSDAVASSFACGRTRCVVLHASLQGVSVSRVEAGSSIRYSNSRVGSVQDLCGEAAAMKLAENLPAVAAAAAVAVRCSQGSSEGDEDETAAVCPGNVENVALTVDLTELKYRDALVHAFGYRAYRNAIAVPQQRRVDAERRSSVGGKGKGGGRASLSLLTALRRAYPREVRDAPGELEKLLARVVQGGSTSSSSDETEPCILAGETLAVPYMQQLFIEVVQRCGGAVWAAVEKDRKAKQRQASSSSSDQRSGTAETAHQRKSKEEIGPGDLGNKPSTPLHKRFKKEMGTSTCYGSSSSISDESGSDYDDDDDMWLHLQPTPLPTAPWWLPLLGASVVSRLSDQDLQRAVITEEEARESNGTVVHWKVLL